MNNEEWGVTERGFHRPTYVELLNAIEYKARELFGDRANLTVRSPLGLFLRVFAWILNILFSLMEDVYNSRFVDTAEPLQSGEGHRPVPSPGAKGDRLCDLHRDRRDSYPLRLPSQDCGRASICRDD